MKYNNLKSLIFSSRSSMRYFISLPVKTQMSLHNINEHIKSAYDLHFYADYYSKQSDFDI